MGAWQIHSERHSTTNFNPDVMASLRHSIPLILFPLTSREPDIGVSEGGDADSRRPDTGGSGGGDDFGRRFDIAVGAAPGESDRSMFSLLLI